MFHKNLHRRAKEAHAVSVICWSKVGGLIYTQSKDSRKILSSTSSLPFRNCRSKTIFGLMARKTFISQSIVDLVAETLSYLMFHFLFNSMIDQTEFNIFKLHSNPQSYEYNIYEVLDFWYMNFLYLFLRRCERIDQMKRFKYFYAIVFDDFKF